MKQRAIILALAGASALLPARAHAAEDFCGRLIIQAINQFCQWLPNGSTLCQPIALVGPSAECKNPERQGVLSVPLGPPTIQPLAPWAAPYGHRGLPLPAAPTALSPFRPPPAPSTAPAPLSAPSGTPGPSPDQATGGATGAAPPLPVAETASAAAAEIAADTTTTATDTTRARLPEPPSTPIATPAATLPATPDTLSGPASAAEAIPATPPAAIAAASVANHDAPATVVAPVVEAPPVAAPAAAVAPVLARTTPIPATTVASVLSPTPTAPQPEDEKAADALAHFDFDSALLTEVGRAELDAWLATAPGDGKLRVYGHADRLGPEPYNLKLSLRRAEAVKQYLISKGISPQRIELVAKGESDPVKRCKGGPTPATKDCLAPNRRAVIDP